MNNQKCKVRREIVNVNSDEPMYFPLVLKQVNLVVVAKLCISDVVKNLNVRVVNLMSITNETRYIEWYETCKCKCRLDVSVCNNKQR